MIMKLKYIFLFSATLLMGTSCSDFLDKEPISDNVDGNFFIAENQLEPYCNNMYSLLPDHGTGTGTFGYFTTDNNSDDMTTVDQVDNFLPQRIQVPSTGSYTMFDTIRNCNLFLERTDENIKKRHIELKRQRKALHRRNVFLPCLCLLQFAENIR